MVSSFDFHMRFPLKPSQTNPSLQKCGLISCGSTYGRRPGRPQRPRPGSRPAKTARTARTARTAMAAAAAAAVKRRQEVEAAIAAGEIHPVCLGRDPNRTQESDAVYGRG